ncbi:MAG TPA: hypothetical protein VGK67_35995 [Myxococcales bacterium]|jgi:hypothetical protein
MPRTARHIALAALLLFAAPAGAQAADPLVEPSSSHQFERAPVVSGTRFVCLGTGIRKKLFFSVYAIDFCVEAEAGRAELARYLAGPGGVPHAGKQGEELARSLREDPEFFRHLMEMPVEKRAELVFLRNVDRGQLGEAFTWVLLQALGEEARPRVEAFVSKLAVRNVREGEKLALRTRPDGQVTAALDEDLGVRDEKLASALWKAYLGPESVTPALKDSVAEGAALLAPR